MFDDKRYITKGISEKISLLLQLFMWQRIDSINGQKDYLQVFKLSMENRKLNTFRKSLAINGSVCI